MAGERQEPARPSAGLLRTDAAILARAINQQTCWYAELVPAWRLGEAPLTPVYWVKCCYYGFPEPSRWYYIGSETEWQNIKIQHPAV